MVQSQGGSPSRHTWWWPVAALVMLLCTARVRAQTPGSGELRLVNAGGVRQELASLDTDVHYRVDGRVAHVTVHQRFRNTGKESLKGDYLLPLPDGATVYAMTLHIGKRTITGNFREKQAARQRLGQASASGHKAALVQSDSGTLFRTVVTNVAPGETVDLELRYRQRVDDRNGTFSLRFPLTFTPRHHMGKDAAPQATAPGRSGGQVFTDARNKPRLNTHIQVQLNPGVPLAWLVSPSHTVVCTQQDGAWTVRLLDHSVVPDRDFVLQWMPKPQRQPHVARFVEDVAGTH